MKGREKQLEVVQQPNMVCRTQVCLLLVVLVVCWVGMEVTKAMHACTRCDSRYEHAARQHAHHHLVQELLLCCVVYLPVRADAGACPWGFVVGREGIVHSCRLFDGFCGALYEALAAAWSLVGKTKKWGGRQGTCMYYCA